MRVRILSEWNGSGRCGSVVEIDDVVATGPGGRGDTRRWGCRRNVHRCAQAAEGPGL